MSWLKKIFHGLSNETTNPWATDEVINLWRDTDPAEASREEIRNKVAKVLPEISQIQGKRGIIFGAGPVEPARNVPQEYIPFLNQMDLVGIDLPTDSNSGTTMDENPYIDTKIGFDLNKIDPNTDYTNPSSNPLLRSFLENGIEPGSADFIMNIFNMRYIDNPEKQLYLAKVMEYMLKEGGKAIIIDMRETNSNTAPNAFFYDDYGILTGLERHLNITGSSSTIESFSVSEADRTRSIVGSTGFIITKG